MNEATWMTSSDLSAMLAHVRGKVSDRKLRLFAVACCRSFFHLLTDDAPCINRECRGRGRWRIMGLPAECPDCHGTIRINRSRRAVEVAERFADRKSTEKELSEARSGAADVRNWGNETPEFYPQWMTHVATCIGVESIISVVSRQSELSKLIPPTMQAALFREVIGNLWLPAIVGEKAHPSYIHPEYLTPTVLAIAKNAYESRDFSGLPILADALEEAGCDNSDMLRHCRGLGRNPKCIGEREHEGDCWTPLRGPHVRGCWVLDLILGKS